MLRLQRVRVRSRLSDAAIARGEVNCGLLFAALSLGFVVPAYFVHAPRGLTAARSFSSGLWLPHTVGAARRTGVRRSVVFGTQVGRTVVGGGLGCQWVLGRGSYFLDLLGAWLAQFGHDNL